MGYSFKGKSPLEIIKTKFRERVLIRAVTAPGPQGPPGLGVLFDTVAVTTLPLNQWTDVPLQKITSIEDVEAYDQHNFQKVLIDLKIENNTLQIRSKTPKTYTVRVKGL